MTDLMARLAINQGEQGIDSRRIDTPGDPVTTAEQLESFEQSKRALERERQLRVNHPAQHCHQAQGAVPSPLRDQAQPSSRP